jgi:hypothetical protein
VRSVYDTDGLQRMSETVLAAVDLPAGCSRGIAMTAPSDPMDTRSQVADLVRMKDPANAAYQCAPAWFVRAVRAVAPQSNTMGMREAIGETEFEPQQILGYAPVEPDGSFKLLVPADTPLALSITDAKGRALQTHLNWIQVRPGERRTCDGCHSPRRGAALNSGAIVNAMPQALMSSLASNHQSGETLASLRTRLDAAMLNLRVDMSYVDVWADTSKAGVTARPSLTLRYTGNANAADDLATPAPVNGIINYPDHIQAIWSRDRGANTCTTCHADSAKLDLRATVAGTGRLVSYEELLVGDPVIDPATGLPVTRLRDGVPEIERGPALVEPMAGNAAGIARSSRLAEIMFGETLKADAGARTAHPNPPSTAPNHATLLNLAEKRLITEWMDLGGQYFNNLGASTSPVRSAAALSRSVFDTQVMPILQSSCAACHQPTGNSGASQTTTSFLRNRFVLTGSAEGDFNVTLSMISNTCQPASNYLLSRPSTVPHPAGALGRCGTGLRDRPHEPGQLSRHRHAHLVVVYAPAVQFCIAPAQPQLRLPGDGPDRFSQRLLARLGSSPDARGEPIVPCRLGKQPARVRVAGLGDRALAEAIAAGVLRGHQPQVSHQLARVIEACDIPNLGHQSDRRDHVDAAQRLQRLQHRREAPAGHRGRQRLGQPLHALVGRLHREVVLGERHLAARVAEVQLAQPAVERLRPRGLAAVADLVAQQKRLELVTGLRARVHRILARPRQVADRLVAGVRNPHRAQLARAREFGQAQAVTPVGLDAIARAFGNQRRGDDLAAIALRRQRALQPVTSGACLVHHVQRARITQPPQRLEQLGHVVPDPPDQSPSPSARLGRPNRDRILVYVQSDVNLDTLFHGRPPLRLPMTRSRHVARRGSPRNLRLRRPVPRP